MLEVYADFAENFMSVPVLQGTKTESERFAGALETYCIEALMQDGKALQAGTSHFLGQNFAKAFDVKFATKDGGQEYVWATSWGVSTRLMGALIMTHSDDYGLVLPPKLAPIQVVIVPIYKSPEDLNRISNYAEGLIIELKELGISVKYDDDDQRRAGWKFAEYEMKGVPIRIAIGPKDMENSTVELSRRDVPGKEGKEYAPQANLAVRLQELLEEIQVNLFQRASSYRQEMTTIVDNYDDFKKTLTDKGGFIMAHWDGSEETEKRIKDETKATIRCILHGGKEEDGKCIYSGKPSKRRVVFAKAY